MNWQSDFVGIPFEPGGRDRSGLDCWGLVLLVYKEVHGVELPGYDHVNVRSLANISRNIERIQDTPLWIEPNPPETFDIVLMNVRGRSWTGHVGILASDRQLLHIERGTGSVIVPINHMTVRHRLRGFRRYVDRMQVL